MNPDDIFAPGIVDEEREHRNRWADARGSESRSEAGWWPVEDDEGEAVSPDWMPW